MRKESSLDKIDNYLNGRSASEAQMVKLFAGLIVALLVYLLVFPEAQAYFDAKKSALDTATKNLNEANSYIAENGPKIPQRESELSNITNQLNDALEVNKYFNTKLQEVSALTYNEKNWANFLDSLTSFARDHDIKVFSINSDIAKDTVLEEVQPMLHVSINAEGTFHSMLKYINSIEESDMVVDIKGLDINSANDKGDKIGGDIKISVWGLKYR